MKRIRLLLLVLLIGLVSYSNVFAAKSDFPSTSVVSVNVSTNNVVLTNKGASEFIDVIIKLNDGTSSNVNIDADWKTDNQDVAVAYEGRILATGKGNATITFSYKDITKSIKVKVLEAKNLELEAISNIKYFSPMSLTTNERNNIINKCSTMINYWWKPTKTVRGWRNNFTFTANTVYNGIPYSQTEYQKDDVGFGGALTLSDFYDNYTRILWNASLNKNETVIMPKYGNDCSGFTSFAWGISRQTTSNFVQGIKNGTYPKVGSYNADNPTSLDLKNSYQLLQPGDAVVKSGHVFVIAQNNSTFSTPSVYAYEQTPYIATFSIWTYDQMANDKYMPFTKN